MQEKVSVITPLYNGREFIEKTIKSVQAQTYTNWEMLIVDDGSTDGSDEVVSRLAESEARIRLLKNPSNQGVAYSRNHGLKEATGRYVAFLDSDDLWKPEKLQHQIDFMESTQAAFTFTSCDVVDEKGRMAAPMRVVPDSITYQKLLLGNPIPCLTVMADLKQIPKEKLEMPCIPHEDYAAWLTVAKCGYEMRGLPETLGCYRVKKQSLSGNKLQTIGWQWNIYRKQEKLPLWKAAYCLVCYGVQGIKKRV